MQRISAVYVALLLTLFLLGFPSAGYEAISRFKYVVFLLVCGGYVAVIALLHTRQLVLAKRPSIRRLKSTFGALPMAQICLLGFLLFTILSGLFSAYPGTFLGTFRSEGVLTIGIYVLVCLFLSAHFRPKKWMLFLFGAGIGLTSLIALIQLTGANPLGLYPAGFNYYDGGVYYSGKFLGTLGNAGLLAGFMSLAVGLLAMALIKFDFRERWFLALPFFFGTLLIFEMGINAALVALVAGFTLMLPVAVTGRKSLANTLFVLAIILGAFALSEVLIFQDGPILFAPLPFPILIAIAFVLLFALSVTKDKMFAKVSAKWYRLGAVFAMAGAICAALITLWLYGGEQSGLIYEASQALQGRWEDEFGTRRIYIWRNIFEHMRLESVMLGTGPDTLGFWAIPPFTRFDEILGTTIVSGIDAAHNEYLHILATGGILSLLAYLGALVFAAVKWLRHPENKLAAVAGAGVLFYAIQAFFGISQFIAAPFFWTCFGVLLYAQNQEKKIAN